MLVTPDPSPPFPPALARSRLWRRLKQGCSGDRLKAQKSPGGISLGASFLKKLGQNQPTSLEAFCRNDYWRKRWDSNPRRVAPRWFSRPVHSTTLPHFRFWLRFEFYIAGRKKSSLLRSVRTPLKDSTVHHCNIRLVARPVIDLFACRQSWSSRRRVPEATPEA